MPLPDIEVVSLKLPNGWAIYCLAHPPKKAFSWKKQKAVKLTAAAAWGGEDGDADYRRIARVLRDQPGVSIEPSGDLIVPDAVIRDSQLLSDSELPRMGLPKPCPWRLQLKSNGPVLDPATRIEMSWMTSNHVKVIGIDQVGTSISSGDEIWLLRDPLLGVVEAVETVNAAKTVEERLPAQARLLDALGDAVGQAVAESALSNMVIYQAKALGIRSEYDPVHGYSFFPELLGEIGGGEDDVTFRELLSPHESKAFSNHLDNLHILGEPEARTGYALRQRTFIALDRGVAAALGKVREVNRSDVGTRKAFFHDRMSFLLPVLEAVNATGAVIQYAERVIGVQPWKGYSIDGGRDRDLPWWEDMPEGSFHIVTDAKGEDHPVTEREVGELQDKILAAKAKGETSVSHNGKELHLDDAVMEVVNAIVGVDGSAASSTTSKAKPEKAILSFLATKSNLETLEFTQSATERLYASGVFGFEPGLLKTSPRPHQDFGIRWLQESYAKGMRGLLMADDMGLGKTFQVLAFMAWARSVRAKSGAVRLPILIVAPTSLLGNWKKESEEHLGKDALGANVITAYGDGLKSLKIQASNDVKQGQAVLDYEKLQSADLVLTTYETFRDYHISFGRVSFDIVAFDEAQKLKESSSMVSQAARSANAVGMRVLMTGTPVENGLMDLWNLMDIAWPGRHPYSAKEFKLRYIAANDNMDELKAELHHLPGTEGEPRMMLRRMKTDPGIAASLPNKLFKRHQIEMPAKQAKAYDSVLRLLRMGNFTALTALQALKSVSLHPSIDQDLSTEASYEAFINASARWISLFKVMDKVKERGEKILVFVDSRKAQIALQKIAKHRYGLRQVPDIINGETTGLNRTNITARFQARKGFDVLLLGPKAAGFGLTLTAANHVFHLNRWWNPAVEDQCTDRAFRIGSTLDVYVHLPIAQHPELARCYDTILDELLEAKRAQADVLKPAAFTSHEMAVVQSSILGIDRSTKLNAMDWKTFESWVAQECKGAGVVSSETKKSWDGGADVVLKSGASTMFVQIKHRQLGIEGDVEAKEVLEVMKASEAYGIANAKRAIVTNGMLTEKATIAAQQRGIAVIDCASVDNVGKILKAKLAA